MTRPIAGWPSQGYNWLCEPAYDLQDVRLRFVFSLLPQF
jgi:hypothetical protein